VAAAGSSAAPLPLDLALQGGGSHGAFTWGVLDRLLDEEAIHLSGVSGTSAGAMNAVALAAGLMQGGRTGAQAALRRLWQRVAQASPFSVLQATPWGALFAAGSPWAAPLQLYTEWLGRVFSPYQLNPLNLNPLRDILQEVVDFEQVRACRKVALFIAATDVATGELKVFRQQELTADMVLASACLPLLFQAVQIEGRAYWDGGYAGNPSLMELVQETPADDLLLVQINPQQRPGTPTTASDILDRLNEVTFNASLLKELRHIARLQQLIATECDVGRPPADPLLARVQALRVHRLDADPLLAEFGAGSKLNTQWSFLQTLHARGRAAADAWWRQHHRQLGRCCTVDLAAELL
jgi:NTE family protein